MNHANEPARPALRCLTRLLLLAPLAVLLVGTTQARAANPRPTDAALRHRTHHALREQPDGTLTFKMDKALREQRGTIWDRTADQLWADWRSVSCPVLIWNSSSRG